MTQKRAAVEERVCVKVDVSAQSNKYVIGHVGEGQKVICRIVVC